MLTSTLTVTPTGRKVLASLMLCGPQSCKSKRLLTDIEYGTLYGVMLALRDDGLIAPTGKRRARAPIMEITPRGRAIIAPG